MEDRTALLVRLRGQLEELHYRLDSLGAAKRLAQRGRIADVERRICDLRDAIPAAPEAVQPA